MALLNDEYGFLFLFEPYSGSRTTRERLLHLRGSKEIGWHHASYGELYKQGLLDGATAVVYSVVRHPGDFLVTQFLTLNSWHYAGFERFVRCELENKHTIYKHAEVSDRTISYSELEQGLKHHFGYIDPILFETPLKRIGVSTGKDPVHDYYSIELIEFVASQLATDFDRFGFDPYMSDLE